MARDNPKPEDGWIEWSGGECPVPVDAEVEIKFASGEYDDALPAGRWDWRHISMSGGKPSLGNIIAYRVVRS
jgi:hypothetical protein